MNIHVQTLSLFNERVEKLRRSGLAQRMADPHYTLDYERMMRREWLAWDGVTETTVDAFVLNIRLLREPRDGFSIDQLAKKVYALESIPADLRSGFVEQRQRWHEHTDRPSVFEHPDEDRNFTNGELFDVLMYGGIAHANHDKVRMFHALTTQGAYSAIIGASFLSSLQLFMEVLQAIHDINVKVLKHWSC